MDNKIEPDVFEDLPFPEGVTTTDWAGVDWKELTPDRVAYIARNSSKRGKIADLLSRVGVGEGRKRENLPDYKTAKSIRNSLYRAAARVWGTKSAGGKTVSNIKVMVTKNEDGTYQVEFVHLAPEKTPKIQTQRRNEKEAMDSGDNGMDSVDPLWKLCLRHETSTITAPTLFNALKRGGINTIDELKTVSLDDIENIRYVGENRKEVIAKMKAEVEME